MALVDLLLSILAKFPTLNKEIFVKCKPDPVIPHLTAGNLEMGMGNLITLFLKLVQETSFPNSWQVTVTTPLRDRHIAQTAATTLLTDCASTLIF